MYKIDHNHKIHTGARCRAGDGTLVTIVRRGEGDRWIASNGWRYSSNGRFDPEKPNKDLDLKEFVPEYSTAPSRQPAVLRLN